MEIHCSQFFTSPSDCYGYYLLFIETHRSLTYGLLYENTLTFVNITYWISSIVRTSFSLIVYPCVFLVFLSRYTCSLPSFLHRNFPLIIYTTFSSRTHTKRTSLWHVSSLTRAFNYSLPPFPLSRPRLSPTWKVSERALRAITSDRLRRLAQPRLHAAGWQPEHLQLNPVSWRKRFPISCWPCRRWCSS